MPSLLILYGSDTSIWWPKDIFVVEKSLQAGRDICGSEVVVALNGSDGWLLVKHARHMS